ncbi:TadE/TadG family type IV pilus assembly protein [Roseomonas sp. WA12]
MIDDGLIIRAGRILRTRRGATAVEFALVGGLLMVFMIGIIEVGRYMITREAVRSVTADAVRLATLRGSANMNSGAAPCQNLSGSLGSAVRGGPMLRLADLSVTLSDCATAGGMTSVTVTVTYPFNHLVPRITAGRMLLREQAMATIF